MGDTNKKGILRLKFGEWSNGFLLKERVVIARDLSGEFYVKESTNEDLARYVYTRRLDLGSTSRFKAFCNNLFEDIARYIEMSARRGGYPQDHRSTFNIYDEGHNICAQIKLSSDPGYVGNYDPENNPDHRGPFRGRPEQYKPRPY